ncbi:MAG: hypothetical protein B7Y80_20900 [Hyphomicrobium sp. 32-62-53]|jgi:hypothetical protein|nr:MAG: hypothetical protein B7Z29_20250 [Hyphomicrobium sp. 12-62-95]OYX97093.1 MAG: hypothetical protein B7Y80_20900 [Hyphomicrobium sp. 32-62-53]
MSKSNVKVAQPVLVGGQTIIAVTLRRPKVKDRRALNHLDVNANDLTPGIEMAVILTRLTPETIDDGDAADVAAICDVAAGLIPKPPEGGGGARSSPMWRTGSHRP